MDKYKLKRLISKYNYLDLYLQEIKYKYNIYNDTFLKEYYEINPPETKEDIKEEDIKEEDIKEEDIKENKEEDKEDIKEEDKQDDKEDKEDDGYEKHDIEDEIIDPLIKDAINKLYRKISLRVHPDKPNGDKETFIKALESYNSNNILDLIILADLYNIDYVLNDTIFSYIENKIDTIDQKINELQHHVCWLWCNADEDTKKKYKLPKQ